MKKNLIYTVTFLLCGAFLFSSCEDMLAPDSNRVEYEFEDWTFGDSVYSVLGILKSVQQIGDRTILLDELRGDLLATNNKTTDDILDISNYEFDVENNKYLDVKDYFTVINNCNVFLARVDTTLEYDNRRLMLREYVAVKSIRAWTYMQLIKNHAYIPYFTEPVLTHSKAEEIMAAQPADQLTVIDKLIKDIAPYENPAAYQMPLWEIPNFVDKSITSKLFMPIRVLLGDLYLWRASLKAEKSTYPLPFPNVESDFAKAAKCFYTYLANDNRQNDYTHVSSHSSEKPDKDHRIPNHAFLNRFFQNNLTSKAPQMVSIIHYADDEITGMTSNLASVFAPQGEAGQNQVVASPSIVGLSARQIYNFRETKSSTSFIDYIVKSEKWPGDLRLYSTVASQRGTDLNKTLYNNMILKFNATDKALPGDQTTTTLFFNPESRTNNIILDRPEHIYLRFAEALMGLEREGWSGAKELAMTVLKSGVKEKYTLYWKPETLEVQRVDADGKKLTHRLQTASGEDVFLKKYFFDEETGDTIYDEETNEPLVEKIYQLVPTMDLVPVSDFTIVYDFTNGAFSGNKGIHSRGSGTTESNPYYALTDSCVAKYFGIEPEAEKVTITDYKYNDDRLSGMAHGSIKQVPVYEDEEETIYKLDENGNVVYEYAYTKPIEVKAYKVTDKNRIDYMYDKIIDEMALEMAWEGHRFGNLARMATALGDVDFLAKRVAARGVSDADWRTAQLSEGWNAALYSKLSTNKDSWYMPLPDNYVIPAIVPATPDKPVEPETPEQGGDDVVTPDAPEQGGGDVVTPDAPEQGGDDVVTPDAPEQGGDEVTE